MPNPHIMWWDPTTPLLLPYQKLALLIVIIRTPKRGWTPPSKRPTWLFQKLGAIS